MPDPGERYLSNGRGGGTIAITSGWAEIAAGVSTRPRVNFIPWNLLFFFGWPSSLFIFLSGIPFPAWGTTLFYSSRSFLVL